MQQYLGTIYGLFDNGISIYYLPIILSITDVDICTRKIPKVERVNLHTFFVFVREGNVGGRNI